MVRVPNIVKVFEVGELAAPVVLSVAPPGAPYPAPADGPAGSCRWPLWSLPSVLS